MNYPASYKRAMERRGPAPAREAGLLARLRLLVARANAYDVKYQKAGARPKVVVEKSVWEAIRSLLK